MANASRALVADLLPVPDEEWILRLIPADAYQVNAVGDRFLTNALLPSGHLKETEDSYGPSVYVESRLPNGLPSLEDADVRWKGGIVRVQVKELKSLNIDVRYSPDDCDFDGLEGAHASFVGMTKPQRNNLVKLLQVWIWRHPPP